MKKSICLILSILLLLSFAGCGEASTLWDIQNNIENRSENTISNYTHNTEQTNPSINSSVESKSQSVSSSSDKNTPLFTITYNDSDWSLYKGYIENGVYYDIVQNLLFYISEQWPVESSDKFEQIEHAIYKYTQFLSYGTNKYDLFLIESANIKRNSSYPDEIDSINLLQDAIEQTIKDYKEQGITIKLQKKYTETIVEDDYMCADFTCSEIDDLFITIKVTVADPRTRLPRIDSTGFIITMASTNKEKINTTVSSFKTLTDVCHLIYGDSTGIVNN